MSLISQSAVLLIHMSICALCAYSKSHYLHIHNHCRLYLISTFCLLKGTDNRTHSWTNFRGLISQRSWALNTITSHNAGYHITTRRTSHHNTQDITEHQAGHHITACRTSHSNRSPLKIRERFDVIHTLYDHTVCAKIYDLTADGSTTLQAFYV